MDLISLIILLVAVGVALWFINTFIPMEGNVKKLLNAVVVIVLVLYVLSLFFGGIPNIRVGR